MVQGIAFDVHQEEDLPIGVQLAWRLAAMIRSGALAPGQRLPGVRELAEGAGVNVNTARSVYRRLEEEGLVASRQGRGTFVAPDSPLSPGLSALAADVAEAAIAQGVEPRELARALYVGSAPSELALEGLGETVPGSTEPFAPLGEESRRAARRTLRGQIARLEAELASYVEAPSGQPVPRPLTEPAPRLADVGELEQVRDELVERLKGARARAESRGVRQRSARRKLQDMQRDPAAHQWAVISEQETGERGSTTWEVSPVLGPVGALMNWWRVKVIP